MKSDTTVHDPVCVCGLVSCLELLAKHPRLHLLWSGGIDSTAVLVAFLRYAVPIELLRLAFWGVLGFTETS